MKCVLRGFLAGLVAVAAAQAGADCGSIPYSAPLRSAVEVISVKDSEAASVVFDPLKVSVFEPKQRALILWNGEEEILLLSTDQRATRASAVLEVIPLPAEPQVRLGSFETFKNAQKLVVQKRMWACAHGGARAGAVPVPPEAGRITFHAKLGVHDLTVAQVLDAGHFVEFVQKHLHEHYQTPDAPIDPRFVKVIESYLDAGFRWFTFDSIDLNEKLQSRDPVEYRFKSDKVYYPLRISTLEQGRTELDLLVFTANGVSRFEGVSAAELNREEPLPVTPAEVGGIEPTWQEFFGDDHELVMDQWTIEGESSKLVRDVLVK